MSSSNEPNNDKNIQWICLPKDATATRTTLLFKLFVTIFLSTSAISQIIFTYLCTGYFRDQITDTSPRSHIQIYKTHVHFFILSGLWSSIVTFVALWGVLAEDIPVILGYIVMATAGLVFQFMGMIASQDTQVIKLKIIGAILDPILMILSLLLANMYRQYQQSIWSSSIVDKKGKSIDRSRRSSTSLSDNLPSVYSSASSSLAVRASNLNDNQVSPVLKKFVINTRKGEVNNNHHIAVPSFTNENIFYMRDPSYPASPSSSVYDKAT